MCEQLIINEISRVEEMNDFDMWKLAMIKELDASNSQQSLTIVDKTSNMLILPSPWVLSIKATPTGHKCKARFIIKGCT
jgi:hypothetical protein